MARKFDLERQGPGSGRSGHAKMVAEVVSLSAHRRPELPERQKVDLRSLWDDFGRDHAFGLPSMVKNTAKQWRTIMGLAVEKLPAYPTRTDLECYFDLLIRCGYALNTVRQHRNKLHALYAWGERRWFVENPLHGIPQFRERESANTRFLHSPSKDFPAILAALPDARARLFCAAQRYNGLRVGEALALEHRHFDLRRGRLIVQQQRLPEDIVAGPTKNGESRDLPLHPTVKGFYEKTRALPWPHRNKAGAARFVMPYNGRHLNRFRTVLREVCPESFPPGCTWHVFRNTFAVDIVQHMTGDRTTKARELLGHGSLASTQTYLDRLSGTVKDVEMSEVYAAQAGELRAVSTPEQGGLL